MNKTVLSLIVIASIVSLGLIAYVVVTSQQRKAIEQRAQNEALMAQIASQGKVAAGNTLGGMIGSGIAAIGNLFG